ncbi:ribosome silencing factor [Bacillus horti]|uniref:Ribosomal silencing factor RsfS n=1 Tax=Caldalkalibacillus horti TaxID=77523 RepID=A0ABT9VT26_9BACI|nr:ribosome silencing factor [Bacillus horti]MDQ0164129.1 ribosome-associated protein [Bacillus horti]
MNVNEVLSMVIHATEEKKGHDPVILNIQGLSVVADYFVICHGNSETQVQSIAKEIREKAFELGLDPKPMEGFDEARWVLLDLGDVVAHIFHREEREYYHLEKLWTDAERIEVENVR